MRRRIRKRGDLFEDLTANEQVQDVINNWGNMFPVLVVTEKQKREDYEDSLILSIDEREYFDDYFIPGVLYEIKGTEFEKYKREIVEGLYKARLGVGK